MKLKKQFVAFLLSFVMVTSSVSSTVLAAHAADTGQTAVPEEAVGKGGLSAVTAKDSTADDQSAESADAGSIDEEEQLSEEEAVTDSDEIISEDTSYEGDSDGDTSDGDTLDEDTSDGDTSDGNSSGEETAAEDQGAEEYEDPASETDDPEADTSDAPEETPDDANDSEEILEESAEDKDNGAVIEEQVEPETISNDLKEAGDLQYGDFTYTVSGSNATITGYTGSAASLTVPSAIGEYTVTAIGNEAFNGCSSLQSLTIPESVTTLGYYMIRGTGIKSITIPKNVTEMSYISGVNGTNNNGVLAGSNLTEVIFEEGMKKIPNNACRSEGYTSYIERVQIPESATEIGNYAFSRLSYMEEVDIPKGVALIGEEAFSGCTSLKTVSLHYNDEITMTESNGKQPHRLTIMKKAFSGCSGLPKIELTDNVVSIGEEAFSYCTSLTDISLGDNVTSIGNSAFRDCSSLQSLTIPESVTTLGYYMIRGTGIKSITIPKNVTEMSYISGVNGTNNNGVLAGSNLTEVIFEEGMKKIPNNACRSEGYTSYIERVQIPESVTEIGNYAFSRLGYMEEVDIPKGVALIGEEAFSDCTSLKTVSLHYNDEITMTESGGKQPHRLTIKKKAFSGCSGLPKIELTDNVVSIGEEVFSGCSSLTEISLGDNVTSIGNSAFRDCSSLQSLTIPESVTTLGYYMIRGTGIKSITIPKNVTEMSYISGVNGTNNNGVLAGSNLTEVIFEEGMKKIPNNACRSESYISFIERVQIPESVTEIGNYAFSRLGYMEEVDIPKGVALIGEEAFSGCTSLKTVSLHYNDEITMTESNGKQPHRLTIKKKAFSGCSGLPKIELTDNVVSIGEEAFSYCTSLTDISLGDSVTSIGNSAFMGCSALESLVLPESVTTLGYYMIRLTGIKSITIPKNVTEMSYISGVNGTNNNGVLAGSNLTEVIFEEGMKKIPNNACRSEGYTSYIERVQIPESVTEIGNYAFSRLGYMEEVDIPKGVALIGEEAFSDCTSLKTVSLHYNDEITMTESGGKQPHRLTIKKKAFSGCSGLPKIELTDNVVSIGEEAFSGCSSLTEISLGDNVTSIGNSAFMGCSALESLVLPESVTTLGYYMIRLTGIKSITIPKNVTEMSYISGVNGTNNNGVLAGSNLTEVIFEEGIKKIPNNACRSESYTSYIEKVQIPASVTEIGDYAFSSCGYLTDIYYALSEEDWNRITNVSSIDASVTIHYNSTELTGISLVPSEITVTVGNKVTVRAVGKNTSYFTKEDAQGWSVNNNLSDGEIAIASNSYCEGEPICQIEGVKEGTCSVTLQTVKGYSATAVVNVVTKDKQVSTVSGKQKHLSGSQNYELEDTTSGTFDTTDPITSEVQIKRGSVYSADKTITIKSGGKLVVEGTLEADKIEIKAGGILDVRGSGRVKAGKVTVDGGFFTSYGEIDISGVLVADTVEIKSYGILDISLGQLIAEKSFKFKGNIFRLSSGELFIGGSMNVNKNFASTDGSLKTIFYGDTTKGKFSFHKESNIGTVFAKGEDQYEELGLGVQNRTGALTLADVNKSETEKWSFTYNSEALGDSWGNKLGAYYEELIKNTESAVLLSTHPKLSTEDCRFITNLATVWVGSIYPQVNKGFVEFGSETYDLVFRYKKNEYRIRYEQNSYGAYANFGTVTFSDADEDDESKFVTIGMTASASIRSFKAQAATYLAEQCVQQYYNYVYGSIPKGETANTLKKKLINLGAAPIKKYLKKVVEDNVFGALSESDYGSSTSSVSRAFEITEILLDGDLTGLWKYAAESVAEEVENSTGNSGSGAVEEEADTAPGREVSDTVVDEFLKAALIEELGDDGSGEPDFSKQENVKFLDLSGRYIQSLDGIQHLENLTKLVLDDNEISDLTPLASLTKLRYLDVSGQNIDDISALSELKQMEILDVSDNPLTSVAAVQGMTELRELDLSDTSTATLAPLASLEKLEILRASDIPLIDEDLSNLENMGSLTKVYLDGCELQSLEGINVSALSMLDVRDNMISDLTPIMKAAKLETLNISENLVETVPSLKACTILADLDLSGNWLMDLSGLTEAPALTDLNVSACELGDPDMETLDKIAPLRKLDISYNNMEDMSALFALKELETLDITGTPVDLADYADLPMAVDYVDADVVKSGDCSDGLKWMIDKTGRLTIYGKGKMRSYEDVDAPWPEASTVRVGEGITRIGDHAFEGQTSLTNVQLPFEVSEIGERAFDGCSALTSLFIPSGVSKIGSQAINNEETTIHYIGYQNEWDALEKGKDLKYKEVICDTEPAEETVSLPEEITLSEDRYQYSGAACTPDVSIVDNGKALVLGTDFTVSYENNTNVGIATVTATGAGKYTGSATKSFMILPGKTTRGDMFNLANNVKVTWKEVPGAVYYKVYRQGVTDPKESLDEPVIVTTNLIGWDKSPGLTNGHAYRYRIVASLTGKDDPSGDSTQSYSKLMYRLKTVVIRSVKNTAPGKVTVKYDKTATGDSYVLQYCERQDMVGAKTKVVLGANKTSFVIGGLKKGKTYYISIRVRKKVNGIDYYTTFGVAKKIKITK